MIYGYARVSTQGQAKEGNGLEVQEDALKAAGAEQIYKDVFTGTKANRPEFDKLRSIVTDGDTIIVMKLDRIARELTMKPEWRVGRVIARPYTGKKRGSFHRTANRRDYSLKPPMDTALDALKNAGLDVYGVGKIHDIFSGQGLTKTWHSESSVNGMEQTIDIARSDFHGLCFVNLVDFDALWGHRRNPVGYAQEIERFDKKLGELLPVLRQDDLLILTADHGNDPTYKGTDHTREHVPFLAYSRNFTGDGAMPQQDSFAVIGATICDNFSVPMPKGTIGTSLMPILK